MRQQATESQGKPRLGSRDQKFTAAEIAALIATLTMNHVGVRNAVTAYELGQELGYDVQRGERNLVSELDGLAYDLGPWNSVGYYIAEWADEVDAGNHSLHSQATKMLEREQRRKDYLAAHPLPRRQGQLFNSEEEHGHD